MATPHLIDPGALERVLDRAKTLGEGAAVVFDLDSTLLDNRRRQARILAEFGRARGLAPLLEARPEHWQDWSIRRAMRNCGLSAEEVERVAKDARLFWRERFFTSEYCVEDRPIVGAPEYVRAVAETRARVVYCTGRHEQMRPGTVENLAAHGFPVPSREGGAERPGAAVHLLMKPRFDDGDDTWKVSAQALLREIGEIIAAFDNEPLHINAYRQAFPVATAVHLHTDDSGRPVPLAEGIVSIRDFDRSVTRGSPRS